MVPKREFFIVDDGRFRRRLDSLNEKHVSFFFHVEEFHASERFGFSRVKTPTTLFNGHEPPMFRQSASSECLKQMLAAVWDGMPEIPKG